MKITVKELVILSMLGSLMFLGQYIFQFIPNIEVVSLFIIIFSLIALITKHISINIKNIFITTEYL